jgi:hypothetical protein
MRPRPVGLLGRIAMPCTASSPCCATSRRQILEADARAARDDHDVGVAEQRARQSRPRRRARGRGSPRRRRRARRARPASVRWRRRCGSRAAASGRQQLVAGDDEPDARLPHHVHVAHADRADDADVLRPQQRARLEQPRAAHDVLAGAPDVLARRYRVERGDASGRPGSASTNSAGSTASAPRGIGAPVITRTAWPAGQAPSKGGPASSRRSPQGQAAVAPAPSVLLATTA